VTTHADVIDFGYTPEKPIRFKVSGQLFETLPRVPADVTLTMYMATRGKTRGSVDLAVVMEFFEGVLTTDSFERLQSSMKSRDPKLTIESDQLAAVVTWIAEQLGNRPTTPPGDSANTQSPGGDSSKDDSPSNPESIPAT
jgi:hypothetical protein